MVMKRLLRIALDRKADKTELPQPSTTVPPSVADAGKIGTNSKYALADHTHQSSVMAARVKVAGATGQATFSFPTMLAAPVVEVSAETPFGATYVNIATVNEGSITTSSATITVVRIAKVQTLGSALGGLLGAVLPILVAAPADTYVNCVARRPS